MQKQRSSQGPKIDCSNLTMIQVNIIQMDDYPADSCAISPTAFLLLKTMIQLPYREGLYVATPVHSSLSYCCK